MPRGKPNTLWLLIHPIVPPNEKVHREFFLVLDSSLGILFVNRMQLAVCAAKIPVQNSGQIINVTVIVRVCKEQHIGVFVATGRTR